jgi:uncharacterized protein YecE (DUF72 family)
MPGRVYTGTSGFSYPEWRGTFYPEHLEPAAMLAHYSGRLPAVEINNTFYRYPSEEVIAGWGERVPEDFRFALKAHRRMTHFRGLSGVDEDVRFFLERTALLGPKRGPILVQLPPSRKQDTGLLLGFLTLIPAGVRVAVEFRDPSWYAEETFALLRKFEAALCIADGETHAAPLEVTGSFVYLRLRRDTYTDDELVKWGQRAATWSAQGLDVFAFVKHEVHGPDYARQILTAAQVGALASPQG